MNFFAHETAIIDEGAQIGEGTRIWHFAHIMGKASIGNDCILGQNVFVANNVVVGDGVKVQNNVSLFEGVILEDDVFIGPSVVFTNISFPRAFIERKGSFSPTIIKKGASIGANATILCGVTIGSYAMIGAGSVVTRDIEDFALVIGNPGRRVGSVGKDGNKTSDSDF